MFLKVGTERFIRGSIVDVTDIELDRIGGLVVAVTVAVAGGRILGRSGYGCRGFRRTGAGSFTVTHGCFISYKILKEGRCTE